MAFGVGQALFEEMIFDEGQLLNGNLGEYMVAGLARPAARRSSPTRVEDDDPDAEIHGLGETALPAVAPAIGNAVSRAIGRRFIDAPAHAGAGPARGAAPAGRSRRGAP